MNALHKHAVLKVDGDDHALDLARLVELNGYAREFTRAVNAQIIDSPSMFKNLQNAYGHEEQFQMHGLINGRVDHAQEGKTHEVYGLLLKDVFFAAVRKCATADQLAAIVPTELARDAQNAARDFYSVGAKNLAVILNPYIEVQMK